MGTIQVGGLATGLDTGALIDRLLQIERQPVTLLQTREVKLRAQATAFTDLNTKLLAVKYKAEALADGGTFFPRTVTSSAEEVATATAAAGATRGTYTVTPTRLARGSIAAATNTLSLTTSAVATGAANFQFKLGASGTVQSVAVDSGTTLEQLVSAVNALNAGVTATAVNTGTADTPAYKLTLTSNATGAANDIVIVSDLPVLAVTNTQSAVDAAFSMTGLGSFTRSTNTFSDVISGVTITLKAGAGSADLVIDYDKTGLQTKVQNLLDAYNTVVEAIDSQTTVTRNSDGSYTSGAFTGDAFTRQIKLGLANILGSRVSAGYQTLADIGITTSQSDGTLSLDATTFQDALAANAQGVSDLFAGPASATTSGIADSFAAAADAATKALTGTIAARQDGITRSIEQVQDEIDAANARIEAHQAALEEQFKNLEQIVSRLQTTSNYLTQQLKALPGFGTSNRS